MYRRMLCCTVAIGLALLTACASSSSQPALPADDALAGEVVELVGVARATDARGERRTLALGEKVTGADTIETEADSHIQIDLFHNGASWGLGPQRTTRVKDSLAWRAPKGSKESFLEEEVGPDRTFAAGRHAERTGAGTLGTAIPTDEGSEAPIDDAPEHSPELNAPNTQLASKVPGEFKSGKLDTERVAEKAIGAKNKDGLDTRAIGNVDGRGVPKQRRAKKKNFDSGNGRAGTLAVAMPEPAPAPTPQGSHGGAGGPPSDGKGKSGSGNRRAPKAEGFMVAAPKAMFSARARGNPQGGDESSDKDPRAAPKTGSVTSNTEADGDDGGDDGVKREEATGETAADNNNEAAPDPRVGVAKVAIDAETGTLTSALSLRIRRHLRWQMARAEQCKLKPRVLTGRLEVGRDGQLLALSANDKSDAVARCLEVIKAGWGLKLTLPAKRPLTFTAHFVARK